MTTGRYLIERLGWSLAVLVAAASLTFALTFVVPNDPARTIAGEKASPEVLARIRAELGLDDPIVVQYGRFMWRLAQGDLGRSYRTREPVAGAIAARLPATAELALAGMLVQLLLGVPAGLLAAVAHRRLPDALVRWTTLVLASVPTFWLGTFLLFAFAFSLALFPLGGSDGASSVVLPALALGLGGMAYYARLLRAEVIEILREDYVRAARAKGLSPAAVIGRHVLRGALVPIVTLAGLDFGAFLGGVVAVERVFNWPGLGSLAVQAVSSVDTPMVTGVVLFSAVAVVTANLVVDVLYRFLDPRMSRIETKG
jgi:peptide/nickel transport system permease protein